MNIRDGWGFPIRHIVCPNCDYVLSGVMYMKDNDEYTVQYVKQVIKGYSSEIKNGGYIENGKLDWLINQIKTDKGL